MIQEYAHVRSRNLICRWLVPRRFVVVSFINEFINRTVLWVNQKDIRIVARRRRSELLIAGIISLPSPASSIFFEICFTTAEYPLKSCSSARVHRISYLVPVANVFSSLTPVIASLSLAIGFARASHQSWIPTPSTGFPPPRPQPINMFTSCERFIADFRDARSSLQRRGESPRVLRFAAAAYRVSLVSSSADVFEKIFRRRLPGALVVSLASSAIRWARIFSVEKTPHIVWDIAAGTRRLSLRDVPSDLQWSSDCLQLACCVYVGYSSDCYTLYCFIRYLNIELNVVTFTTRFAAVVVVYQLCP